MKDKGTSLLWGTVRAITPKVTVQLDGATGSINALVGEGYNPTIGDRCICSRAGQDKRLVILSGAPSTTNSQNVPWTALPFHSNFTNYSVGAWDTCKYCKVNGVVYLRGLMKNTLALSSSGQVATMPAGCRGFTPTDGATNGNVVGVLAHNGSANGTARLQIYETGVLWMSCPTATTIALGSNFTLSGSYIPGN